MLCSTRSWTSAGPHVIPLWPQIITIFSCVVLNSVCSVRNSEDCVTAWQNCVFLAWNGKCELSYGARACLRMQSLVEHVRGLCKTDRARPDFLHMTFWEWFPKLNVPTTVWSFVSPGQLIHFRGEPVNKLTSQYASAGDKDQGVNWGIKLNDNLLTQWPLWDLGWGNAE